MLIARSHVKDRWKQLGHLEESGVSDNIPSEKEGTQELRSIRERPLERLKNRQLSFLQVRVGYLGGKQQQQFRAILK